MSHSTLTRLTSLLCIVALLACLMAGCGSTSSSTKTTDVEETETEATADISDAEESGNTAQDSDTTGSETAAQAEETSSSSDSIFPLDETETLTMYYPWSPRFVQMGYDSPNDFTFYSTLESMTNVHIDFTAVGADVVEEQFLLMMATQDYVDMYFNCVSMYNGGITKAIEDEAFLDLIDYQDLMPNYTALMDSDEEFKLANYTDEGQLGQFLSYGENVTLTQGYVVRQDWLEELGLEMPETYDEWYDVLVAFRTEYDLDNAMIEQTPTTGFYNSEDGDYFYLSEDGEVQFFWADTELATEYLELCKEWYDAGLFTSSALVDNGITDSDGRTMKVNGSTGIFKVDIDDVATYNNDTGAGENYHIVALASPVKESGDTPYGNIRQDRYSNGMTISTACSNIELAVQWLDNFYTEDVILLANYGIENDTFTYDEDGTPHFTEKVLNDEDGLNMALFKYVMDWGPCVLDWDRKTDAYDEVQQECLAVWTNRDISTAYPSFYSYTTEESSLVSEVWNDIETYIDETIPKFIMGSMNMSEYDDFLDALYNMGLDTVLECRQNAYDRYASRGVE